MWEAIIYLVVALIAVALVPRPQSGDARPAALADFDAPTAEPGRPIPVIFGTVLLKDPNVCWYGNLAYRGVYV